MTPAVARPLLSRWERHTEPLIRRLALPAAIQGAADFPEGRVLEALKDPDPAVRCRALGAK